MPALGSVDHCIAGLVLGGSKGLVVRAVQLASAAKTAFVERAMKRSAASSAAVLPAKAPHVEPPGSVGRGGDLPPGPAEESDAGPGVAGHQLAPGPEEPGPVQGHLSWSPWGGGGEGPKAPVAPCRSPFQLSQMSLAVPGMWSVRKLARGWSQGLLIAT